MTEQEHVAVLIISHRHGDIVSVHRTLAGAQRALHAYVAMWWDDELKDASETPEPMPDDEAEAITRYFEVVEDETYSIELQPLGD